MQRQAAQLRALVPGSVVQRLQSFGEMRTSLEASSRDRRSNEAYVAILRDLRAADDEEALAITADHHAALIPRIEGIEGRLGAARSRDRTKQEARNAALAQLRLELTAKRTWLQKRVTDLSKPANAKMTQSIVGPRAGFEIESNKVYVINLSECSQAQRRSLAKGVFPKSLRPHYDKRTSLFGPPGGAKEIPRASSARPS
ncbi:hypothetical protein SAMN05216359_101281 [Roseateles sp. YR242]|nr:hypothetical protein SAMN05216359_101281 [Roseateles sp. YR242]